MSEFVRGDVLAQIGVVGVLFIVKSIEKDGYTCDYYINGTRQIVVEAWVSFKAGNNRMVKVDEWDFRKDKIKEIDGQESSEGVLTSAQQYGII